jgi:hypothetical protein
VSNCRPTISRISTDRDQLVKASPPVRQYQTTLTTTARTTAAYGIRVASGSRPGVPPAGISWDARAGRRAASRMSAKLANHPTSRTEPEV